LKGEEQQISAVLRAQCVDDTARSMSDIKGQLMRSPVGRAWCDGMRWFPMPELENYSGYNRDTRSHIGENAEPDPRDVRLKLEGLYRGTNAGTTRTKLGTESDFVPESGDDGDEIGDEIGTTGTTQPQAFGPFDLEAATKFISSLGTKETTLFEAVLRGFRDGLSPSDIVKNSLKLRRQYQEGKSLCVYLVRKYGRFDLMLHFQKWIEETEN